MSFRVLLFRQDGTPMGELSSDAGTLLSCTRSEEINGEHSLTLRTTRHMEVGTRALTRHADGRWREWVVGEPSETHDGGDCAIGTYHLCWSLQYDLQTVYGGVFEIGMTRQATAAQGLEAALDGTARWTVGTCDLRSRARSVVMNADQSAWDRITTVVRRWGGEVDAEIEVDDFGVTSRMVALLRHVGSKSVKRRFEWGHDLTGITRTPDPGPYVCRVVPLGSGQGELAEDEVTTYDVYLDIRDAPYYSDSDTGIRHNRNSRYLRDIESERLFRVPDGSGGYEYPHVVVKYTTDDVDELFALAKEDVLAKTRPRVAYSGTVANFEHAGMETDGICVGDEVQAVDRGFNPDVPLRIQERVVRMEVDELGLSDARVDIGRIRPSIERSVATLAEAVGPGIDVNVPTFEQTPLSVVPDLPVYTIDDPETGEPYTIPTYDVPSTSVEIGSLASRVESLEGGYVYGSGDPIPGYGGDSIVHQVDGVTITSGTINFTHV